MVCWVQYVTRAMPGGGIRRDMYGKGACHVRSSCSVLCCVLMVQMVASIPGAVEMAALRFEQVLRSKGSGAAPLRGFGQRCCGMALQEEVRAKGAIHWLRLRGGSQVTITYIQRGSRRCVLFDTG